MELLKLLVSNYFIDVAVISWFSAQLIKTLLFYLQNGILQAERMDLSNPNSLFALLGSHPEKELDEDEDREQKELNEFLGHTPLEVLGGALLGILIAMIVPVF